VWFARAACGDANSNWDSDCEEHRYTNGDHHDHRNAVYDTNRDP
jgi:hypothetical protein